MARKRGSDAAAQEQHTPQDIATIDGAATIAAAAQLLAARRIGCLVVTTAKGKLAGILSERDLTSRVLARGLDPNQTLVRDIMTANVIALGESDPMDRAEELMTRHHIRHLPVVADGRVVNMVSSHDVIRHQLRRTDELTGASTRAILDEALDTELARAARYRRPCSAVMLDVDKFKQINDTLGHQVGDTVLAAVGHCLQTEKRTPDVLVRYGGDEFILLLPETDLRNGVRAMERLRLKIKALRIQGDLPVTISCGVAEFAPASDMTAKELLRRADMALFRAKKLGRDRIETWENVSTSGLSAPVRSDNAQVRTLQNHVAALSARSRDFFIQSVHGLVQALEARDPYTKSHSDNVLHYALAIGRTLNLSDLEIETVRIAAMIHDIGKLGIPDAILLKPGRLTKPERQVLEEHPLIAVRILENMRFLERELPAIRGHHERWDGNGYPDHLAGSRIPIEARVLAAADAFDAMTSSRVYHRSRSVPKALLALQECAGTQFDPAVVTAFQRWIRHAQRKLKSARGLTARALLDLRPPATSAA